MRNHPRAEPDTGKTDPNLRHDDAGRAPARGLVGGAPRNARRHGEHGIVLETGVEPPGAFLRVAASQRPTHEGGARSEDRREGLRVDRRLAPPRVAASELCPGPVPARAPRAHALPSFAG